ncbi:CaiF/GrlA family transcriptional regulator [Salmonella enterica subsp. enterica serovar Oslo]|nr:CaiF/GrlA family transcriptional regulator [Salmonella enterica subsp. enterica serovar Oslo]
MSHKTPSLKMLKQGNHEATIIPESVSQYNQQPLYIIIALWCQQQKRWINRNDIAGAFYLPVRRASFYLSYITRRPNNILFHVRQRTLSKSGRRQRCNEIWVEKVFIESFVMRTERAPQADNKTVMGAYRSRVGNAMSGSGDVNTLVMMRRENAEGEDE